MSQENNPVNNTPEQIVTLKTSIIPKLAELGVRKLTVHYSGSGDEGFIDCIDIEPDEAVIPPELRSRIWPTSFCMPNMAVGETEMEPPGQSSSIRLRGKLSTNTAGTSRT